MNKRKKSSRLIAVFLALLTIFSIVPTSTLTASAQTIYTTGSSLSDTGAKKNVSYIVTNFLKKSKFLNKKK